MTSRFIRDQLAGARIVRTKKRIAEAHQRAAIEEACECDMCRLRRSGGLAEMFRRKAQEGIEAMSGHEAPKTAH